MSSVAVIIVSYQGGAFLQNCLRNLFSKPQTGSHVISVWVYDNHSTEEEQKLLAAWSNRCTIFWGNENLGFGKANNILMRKAIQEGFDYVYLINQDVYTNFHDIVHLINVAQEYTQYSLLSPIHLNGKGNDFDLQFKRYAQIEVSLEEWKSNSSLSPVRVISFINAAAWLLRVNDLKKVGLFAPIFQQYGEDNNFFERLEHHQMKAGIVFGNYIRHDRENRLTVSSLHSYKKWMTSDYLTRLMNPNKIFLKELMAIYTTLIAVLLKSLFKFDKLAIITKWSMILYFNTNISSILKQRKASKSIGAFID